MKSKKKVIVMGKGSLAIKICEWFLKNSKYDLAQIVPVVPEPRWTDSLSKWAKKNKIPIVLSGNYEDIKNVQEKNWQVDLVFSVFYDKIIKGWFIKKCKTILNIHNGPLPKYRGVSPINWALKNKELKHGITIHEITTGIDDGAIISQLEYSIYPEFDEVIDVYNRALEYGWTLFLQTMPLLKNITPRPQVNLAASYYNSKQNNLLGERIGFTKKESKK